MSDLDHLVLKGLKQGLARFAKCAPISLSPRDELLFEEAERNGFLTLSHKEAKQRLSLMALWEVRCWYEREPTIWLISGEGEVEDNLAVNVWTTWRRMSQKNWDKLGRKLRKQGFELNGEPISGIRVFRGKSPEDRSWIQRIQEHVAEHLTGGEHDRLKYKIKWSELGDIWKDQDTGGIPPIEYPRPSVGELLCFADE